MGGGDDRVDAGDTTRLMPAVHRARLTLVACDSGGHDVLIAGSADDDRLYTGGRHRLWNGNYGAVRSTVARCRHGDPDRWSAFRRLSADPDGRRR
jgi:hypothetical protein